MAPTKETTLSWIPNFFKTVLSSLVPVYIVKADDDPVEEDLVDPLTELKEKCNEESHVESLYAKYQECNDRVNGRSKTTETCVEELFDYIHELDHCVAHHKLFSRLK